MTDVTPAGACSAILPPARRPGRWRPLLVATAGSVALACLSSLAGLLTWTVLPAALGWRSDVVMSGSMAPAIEPGDVVVSGPPPPTGLAVGQVLLVRPPDSPHTVVHRVSRRLADGRIVLRGDANPTDDVVPLSVSDVQGLARLRVPYVGLPALWLRERQLSSLLVVSLALLAAGVVAVTVFNRVPGTRTAAGTGS